MNTKLVIPYSSWGIDRPSNFHFPLLHLVIIHIPISRESRLLRAGYKEIKRCLFARRWLLWQNDVTKLHLYSSSPPFSVTMAAKSSEKNTTFFSAFIAKFPLRQNPRITLPSNPYRPVRTATLWLSPPSGYTPNGGSSSLTEDTSMLLSADVECLKWQAYIALSGLSSIRVRFDVTSDGALETVYPTCIFPFRRVFFQKTKVIIKIWGRNKMGNCWPHKWFLHGWMRSLVFLVFKMRTRDT